MSDKLAAFHEASTLPDLPDDDTPLRGNGKLPADHLHLTCLARLSAHEFAQLVALWQDLGPNCFVWELMNKLTGHWWSSEFGPVANHGGFLYDMSFRTKGKAMQRVNQVMRSEIENRR